MQQECFYSDVGNITSVLPSYHCNNDNFEPQLIDKKFQPNFARNFGSQFSVAQKLATESYRETNCVKMLNGNENNMQTGPMGNNQYQSNYNKAINNGPVLQQVNPVPAPIFADPGGIEFSPLSNPQALINDFNELANVVEAVSFGLDSQIAFSNFVEVILQKNLIYSNVNFYEGLNYPI